ncbi:hypothetical protein [uncultured Cyclobacterium sp.]|uniref:hypothetical protein n=1 Tax=uncultured Cyclobacterium sp. TaxID=453820 RepID=UPI0030EF1ACA
MKTKNIIYLLAALVGVLLMVIVYQSLSQPGVNDLEGEYTEIAVYRNENNTGPVVRIFAVYTKAELWDDMRAYGDFMPHTKYGNTKVFFFDKAIEGLQLSPKAPYFPERFQDACLAVYEKSAMGGTSFTKYLLSDK